MTFLRKYAGRIFIALALLALCISSKALEPSWKTIRAYMDDRIIDSSNFLLGADEEFRRSFRTTLEENGFQFMEDYGRHIHGNIQYFSFDEKGYDRHIIGDTRTSIAELEAVPVSVKASIMAPDKRFPLCVSNFRLNLNVMMNGTEAEVTEEKQRVAKSIAERVDRYWNTYEGLNGCIY